MPDATETTSLAAAAVASTASLCPCYLVAGLTGLGGDPGQRGRAAGHPHRVPSTAVLPARPASCCAPRDRPHRAWTIATLCDGPRARSAGSTAPGASRSERRRARSLARARGPAILSWDSRPDARRASRRRCLPKVGGDAGLLCGRAAPPSSPPCTAHDCRLALAGPRRGHPATCLLVSCGRDAGVRARTQTRASCRSARWSRFRRPRSRTSGQLRVDW